MDVAVEGILKLVLEELQQIRQSVDNLTLEVTRSSFTIPRADVSNVPKHPAENLEELQSLESFVCNPSNYQELVQLLKQCGGATTKAAAERMMSKLMADALATQFNWAGTKRELQKLTFKSNILVAVIQEVVRQSLDLTSSTNSEIEEALKTWLKQSSTRMKRKFAQKELTEQANPPENSREDCRNDSSFDI